jgi:hypothetical protein
MLRLLGNQATRAKSDAPPHGHILTNSTEWGETMRVIRKDTHETNIIARHQLASLESKIDLLPWQRAGLSYTASGYGRKIPTRHLVRLPGSPKWRRVYCCIFSNSGTCYVPDKQGNWTVIY